MSKIAVAKHTQDPTPALLMPLRDVGRIVLAGAAIGLVTMSLYVLLDKYLFTPALCNEVATAMGRCDNKANFASSLASILGGLVGLFGLVQLRVYRPLLVVILTTAVLWGVIIMVGQLPWWGAALSSAILYGISYALFSWISQLRDFWVSLGLGIVVLLIARLFISL